MFKTEKLPPSVYGFVRSWRLGKSLGVDLLRVDSICSFRCVYCQLGKINRLTTEREVFVPTEEVLRDLGAFDWREADAITFSGSGEPTLARNLGEAIRKIKELTGKPIVVLTNSSLLYQKRVREDLLEADRVFCKLDAWSEGDFKRLNRPAESLRLKSVVEGIKLLRRDYQGFLAIQTMLLRRPKTEELKDFARLLREIKPDEVQLNLPSRPIPKSFAARNRGNRAPAAVGDAIKLKTVSTAEIFEVRKTLAELTHLPVRVPLEN